MALQETVRMLLMWVQNNIAMDLLTGFALLLLGIQHVLAPADSFVAGLLGGLIDGTVLTVIAVLAGIGFGLRGLAELARAVGMG